MERVRLGGAVILERERENERGETEGRREEQEAVGGKQRRREGERELEGETKPVF